MSKLTYTIAIVATFVFVGCASDNSISDNSIQDLRRIAVERYKVSSHKCEDAMQPVWAQLKGMNATEKKIADVTPDQVARLTLPCQRDLYTDACVDADGTLAERLDKFYGTSNGAAVLIDCTQANKDYQSAMDILRIR